MSFKDNFKEGTGWAAAAQALPAVLGLWQASKAKTDYKNKITEIEEFQRQGIVNPYQNLENPYKNLSVATQAARMQAEEADIALANTLDTLRATGKGAGGATALAQAALRSKKDISANIEQQEVANEKLKAQGQLEVDKAKAKGEYLRATMQEAREIGELDRLQGQADLARAQQLQSQYGAISALGSGLSTLAGGVLPPQQLADGELSEKELRQQRRQQRRQYKDFSKANKEYRANREEYDALNKKYDANAYLNKINEDNQFSLMDESGDIQLTEDYLNNIDLSQSFFSSGLSGLGLDD